MAENENKDLNKPNQNQNGNSNAQNGQNGNRAPRRRPALHAGRAPLYVQQLLGLGVFGNMEQPHPQGIGCLSLRGLPLQQALFACLKVFFQQGPAQRAHAYVQSEDNVVTYLHRNILDSI